MKTNRLASRLGKISTKAHNVDSTERVIKIPIDKVYPDPGQVRKKFDKGELEGLAKTIEKHGIIQAITVYPADSEGMYKIQKGERRYRASIIAGQDTIKAVVNNTEKDETLLHAEQIIENIQSAGLTPLEISMGISRLKEDGFTQNTIADHMGKSSSWVSQHLSLLKAKGALSELLATNYCEDATAGHLLVHWQKSDAKLCEDFSKKFLKKGGFPTRSEIERAIESSKNKSKKKPAVKQIAFKLSVPIERKEQMSKLFDVLEKKNVTDYQIEAIIEMLKTP